MVIMIKVITYGTYDKLHYGHIRLLERAKALGDYLIVGVTSGDFDYIRGKINVEQSLEERIEAVRATGLADQIIIEEYEGQKIDDIIHYGVDIFTVGSDWVGKFDYLNEYCKVIYLDRTQGISSTELRQKEQGIRLGLVGDKEKRIFYKYYKECGYVNGATVSGICTNEDEIRNEYEGKVEVLTSDYNKLLEVCDAVYIVSHPALHYIQVKEALQSGKHVLCESPIALSRENTEELFRIAHEKKLILMDAVKTAYGTAYNRLLLLLKSQRIGRVISISATCTSVEDITVDEDKSKASWNSMCAWGPTAMLPIFQILGTDYRKATITSYIPDPSIKYDAFSQINFNFDHAVASVRVGRGIKSEGELIISGTDGYVYVPAPWWNTDYFEIRYENQSKNKRYFYQLDGEGIRYEISAFLKSINSKESKTFIQRDISLAISSVVEQFYNAPDYVIN